MRYALALVFVSACASALVTECPLRRDDLDN